MALIVTSNIDNELDIPNQSNVFKPYSYQNRLLNTFKIPANSEIALQSAKINRTGDLIVSNSNTIFGHFFGPALDKDAENYVKLNSVEFFVTAMGTPYLDVNGNSGASSVYTVTLIFINDIGGSK